MAVPVPPRAPPAQKPERRIDAFIRAVAALEAKVSDEPGQRRERELAILGCDRLRGIVADAALAAHEQHAGGTDLAHYHRVVAGPGRQMERLLAERDQSRIEPGDDAGIADVGFRLVRRGEHEIDLAPARDRLQRGRYVGDGAAA